jgi:hypothetical protein
MKNTTHNPVEPIEQQHYKKKYLARMLQDKEAEDAIRQYNYEGFGRGEEEPPMSEAPYVVEKRQL